MSQLSFSHQFSKHWQQAPEAVRRAIVQELEDIVTLLNPDTELATFNFRHADLNDEIEQIYAELQDQEDESENEDMAKSAVDDGTNQALKIKANSDAPVINSENAISTESSLPTPNTVIVAGIDDVSDTDFEASKNAEADSLTDRLGSESQSIKEAINEDMLAELERKIDDYLSEQMAIMSEDLKAWLREEIKGK